MVPWSLLVGEVAPPLLAHQGGWDEILMVAVPVGLFALLLRAANQRAQRLAAEREADPGEDEPAATSDEHTGNGPRRDEHTTPDPPPRPRGPI